MRCATLIVVLVVTTSAQLPRNPPVPVRPSGPPQADTATQRAVGPEVYQAPRSPEDIFRPDLRYRMLDHFDHIWFCDPHAFYSERNSEQGDANGAVLDDAPFKVVANDKQTYRLISQRLHIANRSLTLQQALAVYREYKKLHSAVQLVPSGNKFKFTIAVQDHDIGRIITGEIDESGVIKVLHEEPTFLACQICPPSDTLIATPKGSVPVWTLEPGMLAWTFNVKYEWVAAPISKVSKVPISPDHRLVRLTLTSGRDVWTVPGRFYGARNEQPENVPHEGGTCDVLVSGETGLYRATTARGWTFADSTLQ